MDKHVVLEQLKIKAACWIKDEQIDWCAIKPEFYVHEEIYEKLLLCIKLKIAGETIGLFEVKYPADWWEAIKERFFPVWAKNKYPVRYTEKRFDVKTLYPMISLPDEQHSVVVFK